MDVGYRVGCEQSEQPKVGREADFLSKPLIHTLLQIATVGLLKHHLSR